MNLYDNVCEMRMLRLEIVLELVLLKACLGVL
jgi:hypothetical protein